MVGAVPPGAPPPPAERVDGRALPADDPDAGVRHAARFPRTVVAPVPRVAPAARAYERVVAQTRTQKGPAVPCDVSRHACVGCEDGVALSADVVVVVAPPSAGVLTRSTDGVNQECVVG